MSSVCLSVCRCCKQLNLWTSEHFQVHIHLFLNPTCPKFDQKYFHSDAPRIIHFESPLGFSPWVNLMLSLLFILSINDLALF